MQENKLLDISFNSYLDFLDTSHHLVEHVLQLSGFDEDDIYWLTIAAREAIANAIKHGNKNIPEKIVRIYITLEGDTFVMKVSDEGEGFDPASIPDPRNPENLLKGSGRGIYYMKTFLDDVTFQPNSHGGTTVVMKKTKAN